MKKILLLAVLVCLFFVGCKNSSEFIPEKYTSDFNVNPKWVKPGEFFTMEAHLMSNQEVVTLMRVETEWGLRWNYKMVKPGLYYIKAYAPQTEGTYKLRLSIYNQSNVVIHRHCNFVIVEKK